MSLEKDLNNVINSDQLNAGKDESFDDPIVRCDSCQALLKRSTLKKHGACTKCGNRRVRNVNFFNDEERKQIEEWGFTDFLKLFEVTEDE
jgi:rRNA maturation endonuclease Nob1